MSDWRKNTLEELRQAIVGADPDVAETVKWRKPSNPDGVPVWDGGGGMICTGETYKDKIKLTFARGASLPDPTGLFNGNDTGATRRTIDVREGEGLDPSALGELVRAAIAENVARKA